MRPHEPGCFRVFFFTDSSESPGFLSFMSQI
jgi:hypothetical protein